MLQKQRSGNRNHCEAVHARVARLVFGARDYRVGAAGTVFDIVRAPEVNHQLAVSGGVLESECLDLVQAFFRARR